MSQVMVEELIQGLINIFQSRLISVILYGSVARGTNTAESDIDIAAILKDEMTDEEKRQLIDFAVSLDLKYDRVFSVVDINNNEFMKWQGTLPFYENVKNEGVVLWTAA